MAVTPLPPGVDQIQRLYQAASRAAGAKVQLDRAADRGSATDFYRITTTEPTVRHRDLLLAVRSQLDTLAAERARLRSDDSLDPRMRELQIDQVTAAMSQVAMGTMMYVDEI